MFPRPASLALLCVSLLAAPLAAEPGPTKGEARGKTTAEARLQRALSDAVARHAADAGLMESLRGYSLSSSILQLRRYTEPDTKHRKLVCIVSLALKDEGHSLVAEVRGNVSTEGAAELDAIDAAAAVAVSRVPQVLAKLKDDASSKVAAR